MKKGGYQIIDLKDKEITVDGSAVVIDGIYESIEGNYRKATLLSGIKMKIVGSPTVISELPDRFVTFTVSSTDYVCNLVEGYQVQITDDDEVSIATID